VPCTHRDRSGQALELASLIVPVAAAGAAASVSAGIAWLLYARFFVRPPPNRALVLYAGGATRGAGESRGAAGPVEIRAPRIVVGGRVFVAPWNRSLAYLSLSPVDVEVTVRSLHTLSGGAASGWEARIGAQAKVPADPEALTAAARSLLGKGEEEIRSLVRQAIENAVPPLLARYGPTEPAPDWERLGAEIQAAAASDLVAAGLVIQNLSVRQLLRIAPPGPAPAAGRPALPRASTAPLEADDRLHAGVDLRLARLERSVGVLGAQIDLLVREGAVPPARVPAGIRLEALAGPKAEPSAVREPATAPGRGAVHDSIGGESPSRSRTASRGAPPDAGAGEPRTLLDTESGG
jgi:hypothetical protein